MANFCEIQIARIVGKTDDAYLQQLAEGMSSLGDVKTIKAELGRIVGEVKNINHVTTIQDMISIFKTSDGSINHQLYKRTKSAIRRKILDALLNNTSLTDDSFGRSLRSLQRNLERRSSDDRITSFIKIRKDIESNNPDPGRIVNYLIRFHLPELTKTWLSDIMSYEDGQFHLNIQQKLRQDWNSEKEEEKEPDANGIIKLLLEFTPLYDFSQRKNASDRGKILNTTFKLTPKVFFAAITEELDSMNPEDYKKFLTDGKYLFEYLRDKYILNPTKEGIQLIPKTFGENLMYSFVYKFLSDDGLIYKRFQNQYVDFSHKLYDIILTAFEKYKSNTFIEYKVNGEISTFSLAQDKTNAFFGKLIDQLSDPNRRKLLSTKYSHIFENLDKLNSDAENLIRELFGFSAKYNDVYKAEYMAALKVIKSFLDSNSSDFEAFCKEKSKSSPILAAISVANLYNPFSISGTKKSKAGKQLPVMGIRSLANSIRETILKRQIQDEANEQVYTESGLNLYIPIFPGKHTSIYTKPEIFKKTIYRASLTSEDDEKVKAMSDLSTPEAWTLAYTTDFESRWDSGIIQIQAITPSDKSKIPFFEFDISKLKEDIENITFKELQNIYAQQWLNTIIDFALVFGWTSELEGLTNDVTKIKTDVVETLTRWTNIINLNLLSWSEAQTNITDALNRKVSEFNKKYGVNKNIAKLHDYIPYVANKTKTIIINPYHQEATELWSGSRDNENLQRILLQYLKNVIKLDPDRSIKMEDGTKVTVNTLLNGDVIDPKFFDSFLYKYFLVKNLLSENILVNTVGTAIAHKHDMSKGFETADSSAHLTMVKRMVALTATMHACSKNVITGLPNHINTVTVDTPTQQMFTYAGNAADGISSKSNLDISDGACWCPGFVNLMLRQSIGDVKPNGIDQKLLLHAQDDEKASAYLLKMANFVIDNAFLRKFSIPGMSDIGGRDPMEFIRMSLQGVKISDDSFDSNGTLIDFNGDEIYSDYLYFKKDGEIKHVTSIIKTDQGIVVVYDDGQSEPCNDLYDIYQAIGAQWSCSHKGVENEASQQFIATLLCKLGNKYNPDDIVTSQTQVDQYAKKQIIHFFPSDSVSKSLKTPINKFGSKEFVVKMDITNFGLQLDPDHEAEDGEIAEITQLMSFISEKMKTPELTEMVYSKLVDLVNVLSKKHFVNFETIKDPNEREAARQLLDRSFGRVMENIFADPNTETKGLINGFMREIKKIESALNSEGFIYSAPYSDHQMLGKAHTSIGSLFRKFIKRTWTGRADVLVPSHNMAMLYEDEEGNTFMYGDIKYDNISGKSIEISSYLSQYIWKKRDDGRVEINHEYWQKYKCTPYNIKFGHNYYFLDQTDGQIKLVVVDSYDKLINLSFAIRQGTHVVPALDKPRNLSNMQAFLKVMRTDGSTEMINMYFLPTLRDIFDTADLTIKKDKQTFYQNVLLPAIANGDVSLLRDELGDPSIESFEYVQYDQERFTTNNYSNVFGDHDMNFAEVQQLKEQYFYNLLKNRFDPVLDISTSITKGIFYSSNGRPIEILDLEPVTSDYTKVLPTVDDEGFIIDDYGKRLFKWIDGAELYTRTIDNVGSIYSIFIPTSIKSIEKEIIEFINSGNFIFCKYCDSELQECLKKIKNHRIYSLENDEEIENIFKRVALRQYSSWVKSNFAIMSRIPAQSVSFAVISKTVGYLPYSNNITMVPNGNVYTQGSDYDIDKVTAIMASIDANGLYRQSSTYSLIIDQFNPSEINQTITDQINRFIEEIVFTNLSDNEIKALVNTQLLPIIYAALENGDINLNKMDFQYKDAEIYSAPYNRIANIVLQYISDVINNPSKLEEIEYNGDHIQNQILETLIKIYHDPRSLYNQSDPTSMQVVKEASASAPNAKEIRSHWDPTTDIYVNQTTSVGKKDISISAVAQKAFYALTYHYYKKQISGESIIYPNVIKWGDKKYVNFGWNGMILKQTDIIGFETELKDGKLSGWKLKSKQLSEQTYIDYFEQKTTGLKLYFKHDENGIVSLYYTFDEKDKEWIWTLVNDNKPIGNFSLTTVNSSLISSSTDNAKEMLMDVMNATPEILPAYAYLLSLNIELKGIVEILTDPIIPELIILAKGNLFNKQIGSRVSKLFKSDIKKQIQRKLGIEINNEKWSTLKEIFQGAEELTALGQALGINGGFKVETGEELLWELKLEKTIFNKTNKRFSIPQFLTDSIYANNWIETYQSYKTTHNILEVLYSVPHFYKMMQVPVQFRTAMQILSKDMDNLYTIGRSLSFNHELNIDILKSLLRAINDRKIVDFLIQYPFKYIADKEYSKSGAHINGENIPLTTQQISRVDEKGNTIINYNGLFSLKPYLENVIIPLIKDKWSDNLFVQNLLPRTMNSSMWKTKIHFWGSAIDLSDPQNEDQMELIRSDFSRIAGEDINGHSILDWMFLYDLMVHKHTIGSNSLTMLFEDQLIESQLIKDWYKFINEYDQLFSTYSSGLRIWKTVPGMATEDEDDDPYQLNRNSRPILLSYSIFPFFVEPQNVGEILLSDYQILKLFNSGKLIAKIC